MRDGETVRMCLRASVLAAILVGLWADPAVVHCEGTRPAEIARPNIVLIVGEDMGPDLGAYGCKDAITPNMLVMGKVRNGAVTFAYPEDAKRNLFVQRKQ